MNNQEIIATLKRLGYLASFLLSAILVISAVEQKQESSASKLTIAIDPLANGRFLIDSSDVYKTIERSFGFDLVGQQIGNLNVERLERVLEADPFVLNADVYINAENQIDIEIQQREPVLRVIDENGLNYYLDKEGNKLPLSPHFTARVLVATGSLPPACSRFSGAG
jgi:cell division protein FtsQ